MCMISERDCNAIMDGYMERGYVEAGRLAVGLIKSGKGGADLLRMVSRDEMGGTPDLFAPKCGWDRFFEMVDEQLGESAP